MFQNDYFLPLTEGSRRGFFSDLLSENLMGLLEVNLRRV